MYLVSKYSPLSVVSSSAIGAGVSETRSILSAVNAIAIITSGAIYRSSGSFGARKRSFKIKICQIFLNKIIILKGLKLT